MNPIRPHRTITWLSRSLFSALALILFVPFASGLCPKDTLVSFRRVGVAAGISQRQQEATLPAVSEETYHRVLDLVFPRDILTDQKFDYVFVLRYEPAFRAESQIIITERAGRVEVVQYTALDGSIELRLDQLVQSRHKEDAKRMARLIRIRKEYANISSKDIKLLHESFLDTLRISERARLNAAKDKITITADGTGYRLWYKGETEVQSDFAGSNITTPTLLPKVLPRQQ